MFTDARHHAAPFPHLRIRTILSEDDADRALNWLRYDAPWTLRIEDFYEQEEFSLLGTNLPSEMSFLMDRSFAVPIRESISSHFQLSRLLTLVDVCAHRLTPGQTIRVHNDFIEGAETHRLLVQLNSGWEKEKGGLLMLFSGPTPEEIHSIILPRHRSGFAFEISHRSFHAVSQIKDEERYTLVYSFRER